MIKKANVNSVYLPSPDVVAREIEGVVVIVPIVSGIADIEDELFSLNETGKAIWKKMDGRTRLGEIIDSLKMEFTAPAAEIREDVLGLVSELLKRRIVVEAEKEPS